MCGIEHITLLQGRTPPEDAIGIGVDLGQQRPDVSGRTADSHSPSAQAIGHAPGMASGRLSSWAVARSLPCLDARDVVLARSLPVKR